MLKFRFPTIEPRRLPESFAQAEAEIEDAHVLVARLCSGLNPYDSSYRQKFMLRLDAELLSVAKAFAREIFPTVPGANGDRMLRYACAFSAGRSAAHAVLAYLAVRETHPHLAECLAKTALSVRGIRENPLVRYVFDDGWRIPVGLIMENDETGISMQLLACVYGSEFRTDLFAEVTAHYLCSAEPSALVAAYRRFREFIGSCELRPTRIEFLEPYRKLHHYAIHSAADKSRKAFESAADVLGLLAPKLPSENERREAEVLVEVLRNGRAIEDFAKALDRMSLPEANRLAKELTISAPAFCRSQMLPAAVAQFFHPNKRKPIQHDCSRDEDLNHEWEPLTATASDLMVKLGFQERWCSTFRLSEEELVDGLCRRECGAGFQFPELRSNFSGAFWLQAVRKAERLHETAGWNDVSVRALYTFKNFVPDQEEALAAALARAEAVEELKSIPEMSGIHAWIRRLTKQTPSEAANLKDAMQSESEEKNNEDE